LAKQGSKLRQWQCEEVVERPAEVAVESHRASRRCSGSKTESQVREDEGAFTNKRGACAKKPETKCPMD
jgi:hypothetical protein